MANKKKYYAVAVGKKPGIYKAWYGDDGAEIQVKGFPKARFKGFHSFSEAKTFLKGIPTRQPELKVGKETKKKKTSGNRMKKGGIILFTDGSALGNPGPGGYGVVIEDGEKRRELSGGFRLTTNNRMELLACIEGLKALKKKSVVTLYSDSRYVINGIVKGWAKKWKKNRWMKSNKEPALNSDLWEALLEVLGELDVEFVWVKGHAGQKENERCDSLAKKEAGKPNLPPDIVYEENRLSV